MRDIYDPDVSPKLVYYPKSNTSIAVLLTTVTGLMSLARFYQTYSLDDCVNSIQCYLCEMFYIASYAYTVHFYITVYFANPASWLGCHNYTKRLSYLIAGSLKDGESSKAPLALFKRPFGCAGKVLSNCFVFLFDIVNEML